MSYKFPPDVDEQMRLRLKTGRYQSEDEVLREAFEALKLQEELEEFRQSIEQSRQQAARGEAKPLDVEQVMERVGRRIAESS